MLVALLVSPVAAQTIDPINGFAIEPFNPACTLDGGPTSIIAGRDGNLWFTERFGNKIGRIAPTGDIAEFAVATPGSGPMRSEERRVGNDRSSPDARQQSNKR